MRVPMTVLNDRLLEDALNRITVGGTPLTYTSDAVRTAA